MFWKAVFVSLFAIVGCKPQQGMTSSGKSTPSRPSEWCALNAEATKQITSLAEKLEASDASAIVLAKDGSIHYTNDKPELNSQTDTEYTGSAPDCDSYLNQAFANTSEKMLISMSHTTGNSSFALAGGVLEVGNPGELLMRIVKLPGGRIEVTVQDGGGQRTFGVLDAGAASGVAGFLKGV